MRCGALCGGGVQEGTMTLAQLSAGFQLLPPLTTSKLGPSDAVAPGGWVCVHSRTLWVSPTKFAVRLGVSLADAIPIGFFSQKF